LSGHHRDTKPPGKAKSKKWTGFSRYHLWNDRLTGSPPRLQKQRKTVLTFDSCLLILVFCLEVSSLDVHCDGLAGQRWSKVRPATAHENSPRVGGVPIKADKLVKTQGKYSMGAGGVGKLLRTQDLCHTSFM
jgi:hypothetical protein